MIWLPFLDALADLLRAAENNWMRYLIERTARYSGLDLQVHPAASSWPEWSLVWNVQLAGWPSADIAWTPA